MSTLPKRKDLTLTPKLKELGFTEIYSIGKTLILSTEIQDIHCKLDNNDLEKTGKYLKRSLDKDTEFADQDKEVICTHIYNILLDSLKQQCKEEQNKEQKEQQAIKNILNDINQLREQNPNLTFEEWQSALILKFDNLRNTVDRLMPEIWPGLEFELSVYNVLKIEDCTLPVIGIILGRPSSSKSVIIDLLRKWPYVYCTDDFTPAAFVSHSTAADSPEALERIDMIPKMKNRLFLTPELSPMFSKDEKDLAHQLGIITKVADGKGYSSDSGAHGHRGYDEDTMFTWVGAAVDIPYKVFKILHTMGPRLYFWRMDFSNKPDGKLLEKLQVSQQFNHVFKEIQDVLYDYLKWFEIGPNLVRIKDNSLNKIRWISGYNENEEDMMYIVRLGRLLSHLRCVAQTWGVQDTQGTSYAYSVTHPEDPTRANTILYNIARGHASLYGRNYITHDDLSIVIHTVFSTAQIERVSIFNLLIANNGMLSTDEILEFLNVARKTALRTMTEFKAIGLVTIEEADTGIRGRPTMLMVLKPEFKWILSDDLITKKIPHTPHIFEGNGKGKGEIVAWPIYVEMEQSELENPSNLSQSDKNTVNRQRFHDRLMKKGQLSHEEAEKIIENMIGEGKLEQPMMGTLRRLK
jgi:polyhydroxyalkanoate synthesis regulator phasin/predicted transcriptional regulator